MFVTLCDKRKIFKIIKWMEGVVNLRESNVLTDLIIHLVKKKYTVIRKKSGKCQ